VAAGWNFCGGKEVRQEEMPMNGGYDAKLVADRPVRLFTILEDLKKDDTTVRLETTHENRDTLSKALK